MHLNFIWTDYFAYNEKNIPQTWGEHFHLNLIKAMPFKDKMFLFAEIAVPEKMLVF